MKIHQNTYKKSKRNTKLARKHKPRKNGDFLKNGLVTMKLVEKSKQTKMGAARTVQPAKRSAPQKTTNSRGLKSSAHHHRACFAETELKNVNKADFSCRTSISCELSERATRENEEKNKTLEYFNLHSLEDANQLKCLDNQVAGQLRVRNKIRKEHTNKAKLIDDNRLIPTGALKNRAGKSAGGSPQVKIPKNLKVGIILIWVILTLNEKTSLKLIRNPSDRVMGEGSQDWKDVSPPNEVPQQILENAVETENAPSIQRPDNKLPNPPSGPLDLSGRKRRVSGTAKDSQLKTPTQIRKASSDSETLTPKSEKITRQELRMFQKASAKSPSPSKKSGNKPGNKSGILKPVYFDIITLSSDDEDFRPEKNKTPPQAIAKVKTEPLENPDDVHLKKKWQMSLKSLRLNY